MWTYASLDGDDFRTDGGRRRSSVAAWIVLGALAGPRPADAQLVIENPRQRWQPGATVELLMRERDVRRSADVEAVLFDDEPIPFEFVAPERASDPIRIRFTVPVWIKPGAHSVSVVSSAARTGVPEIVGLTLQEARRALSARRLELDTGAFDAAASKAAVHRVTRQDPAAGARVRPGTRIAVAVASLAEVPEILGLSLGEARRRLAEHDLELQVPAETAGAVVWTQDPVAGTLAAAGGAVAAEIAFAVPNLLGRRIEAARPALLAIHLVPLVAIGEAAGGPFETVLSQAPAAGEFVPPGTRVTLAIQGQPDPPGPRWPWPALAAVVGLAGALSAKVRARRASARSFRIEAHNDLDRLLESATAPVGDGRELGLDIRLSGHPDPGLQSLSTDGPLVVAADGR